MPGEEEQRLPRGTSTSDESAPAFGDRGTNVGADRTEATHSAPGRNNAQRCSSGVSTPTTITAIATPRQQFVGHDVTIAGRLTANGAPVAKAPITLCNVVFGIERVPIANTTTDASGYYQFTLTESVATTRAYTVCAEGDSPIAMHKAPK